MIIDSGRLQALTVLHGVGLGTLFVLALAGAVVQGYRHERTPARSQAALRGWVILTCVAVWLMVLSGTYLVYPAYKEITAAAALSPADIGKMRHIGRPHLGNWLDIVLFWKEYAAWIAPIGMTMLTFLFVRHGSAMFQLRGLRQATLGFAIVLCAVMVTAAIGGYVLNHDASAPGGTSIHAKRTSGYE